jgi:hypothetical protein
VRSLGGLLDDADFVVGQAVELVDELVDLLVGRVDFPLQLATAATARRCRGSPACAEFLLIARSILHVIAGSLGNDLALLF